MAYGKSALDALGQKCFLLPFGGRLILCRSSSLNVSV